MTKETKGKKFFSFLIKAAACGGNGVRVGTLVEMCWWFVWPLLRFGKQVSAGGPRFAQQHALTSSTLSVLSFCDITEVIFTHVSSL